MKKFIQLFFVIITLMLVGCAIIAVISNYYPIQDLVKFKQDAFAYLTADTAELRIKPAYQQQLYEEFLQHFFSPWDDQQVNNLTNAAKKDLLKNITLYQHSTLWSENYKPYPTRWFRVVLENTNREQLNQNQKAITINACNLRIFPTAEPAFYNVTLAGEGYPFDNFQMGYLPANMPVRLLGFSRDSAWIYALTPYGAGWIATQNVALVDEHFIKQWQTGHYLALLKDGEPITDQNKIFRFQTRLGAINPEVSDSTVQYKILIAVADANQHALIKTALLSHHLATPIPLAATSKNVATIINSLLGQIYGWGGIYAYRDCSITTHDLFVPFGIWLQPNAYLQTQSGIAIALKNKSRQEKEKIIRENGIGFFSLIGYQGHIALYLGQADNRGVIFQNKWGVETYDLFKGKGRKIIGGTYITSLQPGHEQWNVFHTQLDADDTLTFIIPPEQIEKKYAKN